MITELFFKALMLADAYWPHLLVLGGSLTVLFAAVRTFGVRNDLNARVTRLEKSAR